MTKRTTQIRIAPKTAATLRKFAKSLGYTTHQGPTTGQGSVVQMFEALARGELTIVKAHDSGAQTGADDYSEQG
jgi:hypothetical protein